MSTENFSRKHISAKSIDETILFKLESRKLSFRNVDNVLNLVKTYSRDKHHYGDLPTKKFN